jgi:hypothetical protein
MYIVYIHLQEQNMPRQSRGLVKINLFIDPQVLEAAKWLASARATAYSEIIRTAVKKYVVEEIRTEQEDIAVLSEAQEAVNG